MRQNLPVTLRECSFLPDVTLVLVTDPKGWITCCDEALVQFSGCSASELLGQVHNLMPHSGMPAEALLEMLATIKAGRPWSGVVKNRHKDGDHCRVLAKATPVRNGDRVVGFMSVRTSPSRKQAQAADALYAEMRQEVARGLGRTPLSAGRVLRDDGLKREMRLARRLVPSLGAQGLLSAVGSLGGVATSKVGAPLLACAGLALRFVWGTQMLAHRQLGERLKLVTEPALRLAAGNLCAPPGRKPGAESQDQQGALNQLGVNISIVALNCRTPVENLGIGVSQIANCNQDLSARTELQVSSLEQAAASKEQINGTVRQSAASAIDGVRMAEETAQAAQRTHTCVEYVSTAMLQIQFSSARIGDITQVIQGEASHTNSLALSVAMGAARAGGSDRGFAGGGLGSAQSGASCGRCRHAGGSPHQRSKSAG